MKYRILLTGKNGQVGSELAALLPRLGEVTAFDRHQLDLSKSDQIRRAIWNTRPHVIVNAAAYTFVDQAESEEWEARVINADAPAIMAEEAKRIGAALVHYSTDYIFDGSKNLPYDENDPPNPINVYGKTKLAGEQAIQDAGLPHLIFRTAWVYGTRGRNFLLTILRLATEREELRIVRDQFGAPTWSREIAKGTARILARLFEQGQEALSRSSGIYHMTATGETSWFEFGKAILEEASRTPRGVSWFAAATGGHPLVTRLVTPVTTEEYPTLARRPAYSVLSNSRLKHMFDSELPHWRTQLHLAFAENQVKDQSIDP
jgi:dTDP-4-dehydrorhamnose reductase